MISVVIPAYNAGNTIGRCLDALLAQPMVRGGYEVIVVDDGSTDETSSTAQARGVRVISQPNRGAAAARNLGAQHALGDPLLFIDADSVPDACWVANLAAPFADPTLAGASGEKKTHQTSLLAQYVQAEYDFKYERLAAAGSMDFVDSSTAAYRREIFLSNGGFDATLMEAEDTELSFRLAQRGHKMVLVRDAIVYHTHPESLGEYLVRKFQYARWRAVVYARYPRKAASDTRTPPTLKLQTFFAFALIPTILAAFVWNLFVWVAALLLALFVATTLAFAGYCGRRRPSLGVMAPLVLLCTAYAGAAGAAVGFLQYLSNYRIAKR